MQKHKIFASFFFILSLLSGLGSSVTAQVIPTRSLTGIVSTPLQLSDKRTTIIVFAAPISPNGVDRGSNAILAKTVEGIDNVLKVKAASDTMPASNMTVFTTDGRVYRFLTGYIPQPETDFLDLSDPFTAASSSNVIFSAKRLTGPVIESTCNYLETLAPHRRRPASSINGQMQVKTHGIYYSGGVLFFKFTVSNQSPIPFDVKFARCYQRDRRRSKRTSQMEQEVTPLFAHNLSDAVVGGNDAKAIVFAFDKFTIADRKYFVVELFEKNGDRHLTLRIKGKHILNARPILAIQ